MNHDPYPDYMAERAAEEFDGRYPETPDHEHEWTLSGVCRRCKERFRGEVVESEWVRALDLHKERIRRLQEALCECQHREFFQADLHDETCPVYAIAAEQKREYKPRV